MENEITPVRTYFLVYVALLALLAATVALAYINLGIWNLVIAISIAIAKALLVLLYFMHVRHSKQLVKVFAIAGFLWLLILIGLTLTDYISRVGGIKN